MLETEFKPEIEKSEFNDRFCLLFDASAALSPRLTQMAIGVPIKLDSLKISPDEKDETILVSDSIYDLAVKYPKALGWMLKEGNATMRAVFLIGTFMDKKYQLVTAELSMKYNKLVEDHKSDNPTEPKESKPKK